MTAPHYYADKIEALRSVFGARDVVLTTDAVTVDGKNYPIIDDVIILLPDHLRPARLRHQIAKQTPAETAPFAHDIQFTFGEEWQRFPEILPEHEAEFQSYFDQVDRTLVTGKRVCDLGCGIGRWSYFLRQQARELVLVDFSEAIFVARKNLRDTPTALFFMGDLTRLPFAPDFCDFLFCLGVLHHLETNALGEVRGLAKFSPRQLFYLYSALDSRPLHYRALLPIVTLVRTALARISHPRLRLAINDALMWTVYYPFIGLGWLLKPFGLANRVPLFDFYHDKSRSRIRQDVYDRFFTRIEQRFSRRQIETLKDTFSEVSISTSLPMWHFICTR